MYQYVDAICLAKSIGSQWEHKDLSKILVVSIFSTYKKVYLTLSNPALQDNVNVDFDALKYDYYNFSGTLEELLVSIGNSSLPTVAEIPTSDLKYIKYNDAFRAEYKIDICKIGTNYPENYPVSDITDLKLYRPNYSTDCSLIHDYCLVTVNGFIHSTEKDDKYTYVRDGAKTLRKSRLNNLGLISFLDVSKLTKVKIKPTDIYSHDASATLKERIYFDVEESLENKAFFLVLGGYLVFPEENVLWQSGLNTLAFNIDSIPYKERIFESSIFTDISELGLTNDNINYNNYSLEELYSDNTLRNYMTMNNTFLVILEKENIVINKIQIRECNMPGKFTSYQDPTYPLIVGYGRLAEYWKVEEDGIWSVNVSDAYYRNYVISNRSEPFTGIVNSNLVPNKPFKHMKAALLEITAFN